MQIWRLLISINWISSTKEMNPITGKSILKLVIQPICRAGGQTHVKWPTFELLAVDMLLFGPVQTSRNRHVELTWSITFDLSATIARRLNQHFFKFDELCCATRLWHDIDSNVTLNLCQARCIHYDNVYCTIIPADLSDFTLVRRFNRRHLAGLN